MSLTEQDLTFHIHIMAEHDLGSQFPIFIGRTPSPSPSPVPKKKVKLDISDDVTNEDATHQQEVEPQIEAAVSAPVDAAGHPPDLPIPWSPLSSVSSLGPTPPRFVASSSPSPWKPWRPSPAAVQETIEQDTVVEEEEVDKQDEEEVDEQEGQDSVIQLAETVDSDRTLSLSELEEEQQQEQEQEQEVDEHEGSDASIVVDNADDPSTILGQVHYWHIVNHESDITPTQSAWDEEQRLEAEREAARLASADTVSDTE